MKKIVGESWNHFVIVETCQRIVESFPYCWKLLEKCIIMYLLKKIVIIYMSFIFFILLQYDVYLIYFWCIHVINLSYIVENFILSDVFILSRNVIPYVFHTYFWCFSDVFILSRHVIPYKNSASYIISRFTCNSRYYYLFA